MSHAKMKASEPRCIYCDGPSETIDHMPPRAMFPGRKRPDDYVFAACRNCNSMTSKSESVMGFLLRMKDSLHEDDQRLRELLHAKYAIIKDAPKFWNELSTKHTRKRPMVDGLIRPDLVEVEMSGPVMTGHIYVFSAKLGMAIYRNFVECACPLDSKIGINVIPDEQKAKKIRGRLNEINSENRTTYKIRQGKLSSEGIFDVDISLYKYDQKNLLTALATFYDYSSILINIYPSNYPHDKIDNFGHDIVTKPKEYLYLSKE